MNGLHRLVTLHRQTRWEEVTQVSFTPTEEPVPTTPTRDMVIQQLRTAEVLVEFVKADKTHTSMHCTLCEDLIPESARSSDPQVNTDPNLIKVYALDRNGWRSFRLERMTRFQVL